MSTTTIPFGLTFRGQKSYTYSEVANLSVLMALSHYSIAINTLRFSMIFFREKSNLQHKSILILCMSSKLTWTIAQTLITARAIGMMIQALWLVANILLNRLQN